MKIQDEGSTLVQRTILNFVGAGVTVVDDPAGERSTVTVSGSAGNDITISSSGTFIGSRPEINFIPGLNTILTITDDSDSNRVNVAIAVQQAAQTPWQGDINGAMYSLHNAGAIGVGRPAGTAGITVQMDAINSEVALAGLQSVATARAASFMQNDLGDTLTYGVYGSNYSPASVRRQSFLAATNDLVFQTGSNATERMRLTAAGLFGIGTTAPETPLHIVTSASAFPRSAIFENIHNSQQPPDLVFRKARGTIGTPGAVQSGDVLGSVESAGYDGSAYATSARIDFLVNGSIASNSIPADILFYTAGGVERMRILSTGGVGINESAPATALAVRGVVHAYTDGAAPDNNYNGALRVTRGQAAGQHINLTRVGTTVWSIGYTFNTNNFAIGLGKTADSAFTAPQFVIDPTGKVGIGQPNPSSLLTLGAGALEFASTFTPPADTTAARIWYGDTGNANGLVLRSWKLAVKTGDFNDQTTKLFMDPSGNVGIGNGATNPLTRLQVASHGGSSLGQIVVTDLDQPATAQAVASIAGSANDGSRIWYLGGAGGGFGQSLLVWNDRNSPLLFGTAGAERMRIGGNGFVGIGTSTTNDPLTIAGIGSAGQLRLVYGNYGAIWRNDNVSLHLLLTNNGDPYGGFNSLRPFYVTLADGTVHMGSVYVTGLKSGGNAYANQAGDIGVSRDGAPGTGAIYFGNTGAQYIYYDGSVFQFTSTIGTSGRIGVGTTAPQQKLHLVGAGQDGSNGYYWPSSGPDAALYVQDSGGAYGNGGAVLFGASYGSFGAIKGFVTNGAGPMGQIAFYLRPTTTDTALYERMRLYENGDLNIKGRYLVNGAPFSGGIPGMMVQNNTGGPSTGPFTYLCFVWGSNSWTIGQGGPGNNTCTIQWVSTSDARLKTNVRDLRGGISVIERIRPKEFEWNGLAGSTAGKRAVSIIGQELAEVLPGAVDTYKAKLNPEDSEETELLHYDSTEIVMHLVLAVQQLKAELRTLKAKAN